MADESKTFDGTVLVLGATGNVGQAAVNALSAKYGASATIKAGTRNPESDKAKALSKLPGVTVVKASAGDAASVTEEAKGVDVVYVVTPGTEDRAEKAIAAVKAVQAAGVENVVVLSVPYWEDSTHLFAKQFMKLDAAVRELSSTAVLLKLPFFTDNQWGNAATIKSMGKFFAPVDGDLAYSTIAVGDAGEAAAAVIGDFATHKGKTYTLVSDTVSSNDIAAAYAAALGKEVTFVQVPPEAAQKAMLDMGFPAWQVDGVLELWALGSKLVFPDSDLEALIGRKGTTTAAWIQAVKGGFQ